MAGLLLIMVYAAEVALVFGAVISIYQIRNASRQTVDLLAEIAHRLEMVERYGSGAKAVELLEELLQRLPVQERD